MRWSASTVGQTERAVGPPTRERFLVQVGPPRRPLEPPPRPPHLSPALVIGGLVVILSLLFGLPHLLIPRLLPAGQTYTPFAIGGVSPLTFDESSTYAAQLNYTVQRNAPAYDTDVFEDKDTPAPVSTLPYFVLAPLARLLGGVEQVFIVTDFVLPPIAFLFLYWLIGDLTRRPWVALLGALTTVLIPFGPRNFLGVPLKLLLGQTASIDQPLELSRLVNPELSFPLLLAGLLLLWRTLRTGNILAAVIGGVMGGLLFYTYVFYWPPWVTACTILLLLGTLLDRRVALALVVLNLATWVTSIPFWIGYLDQQRFGNFSATVERHLSEYGHVPSLEKIVFTIVYSGALALLSFIFVASSGSRLSAHARKVLLFTWAVLLGGLAGLNMEVLVGFNVEATSHFSNRLFQPFLVMAGFALAGPAVIDYLSSGTYRHWARALPVAWAACIVGLLMIGSARQVLVAGNVAPQHTLGEEKRLLFAWLNANTNVDDVVLASDMETNYLLPVYTHNMVFVPDGERSSVDYPEIERRYLVAMRLLQHSANDVYDTLAQDADHGIQPQGLTYSYYLFEASNGTVNRAVPEPHIDSLLAQFRDLDLPRELGRQRLDYVYAHATERLAAVPGWTSTQVYVNAYGSLWRLQPTSAGE